MKFPVPLNSFAMRVEQLVAEEHISYLEAIAHFGEENNIEVEALAMMVNKSEPIKMKLEAQCMASNCLKNGPRAVLDPFLNE